MINDSFLVDSKKVAKQASGLGEFMLMKCDSGNLLITGQFVLSVSDDQFFSIRCKLEVPKLETWYLQTKEGLVKSEREPGILEWERRYNEWFNEANSNKMLTNTRIELSGCYLYTDGFTYIAIKQERLDMLQYTENLTLSGRMVVIDGVHVLAPMSDTVWKNNNWLCKLPGMNEDREMEDEK
ncbi:hypothetical protein Ga0466249_002787 [Sporomusaceae bacterium BoRhaA]|uniref:hypothetical protein n=1 Tax=Pelorhabdus rhamnosifermentans TaxID=2772457 RepID=UPI001C061657|nr:hypothetical protein [Pelorhabdus rhamnosifermentans]MBU2701668.1 hypothetical protein [Pelorhabdus rhamnosifermentans]